MLGQHSIWFRETFSFVLQRANNIWILESSSSLTQRTVECLKLGLNSALKNLVWIRIWNWKLILLQCFSNLLQIWLKYSSNWPQIGLELGSKSGLPEIKKRIFRIHFSMRQRIVILAFRKCFSVQIWASKAWSAQLEKSCSLVYMSKVFPCGHLFISLSKTNNLHISKPAFGQAFVSLSKVNYCYCRQQRQF